MVVRALPPARTEHNPEKSKASWMSLSKHTCGMSETGWTAHAHQQSLAPTRQKLPGSVHCSTFRQVSQFTRHLLPGDVSGDEDTSDQYWLTTNMH